MMKLAKKEHAYQEREDGYIGKCHLCIDVRKHIVETGGRYKELAPRFFYDSLSDTRRDEGAATG